MEKKSNHDLRRNIFKVPEGYFDRLAAELLYQVDKKTEDKRTIPLWKPALRIAALLVVGAAAWMAWPTSKGQTAEEILAEIEVDDLSMYMEESTSLLHEDILLPAEEFKWESVGSSPDTL